MTSDAAETITTKEHALRSKTSSETSTGQFLLKGMPRESPACHGEDDGAKKAGVFGSPAATALPGRQKRRRRTRSSEVDCAFDEEGKTEELK